MKDGTQIDEIIRRRELAKGQGDEFAVTRQHARGHLTIRKRIVPTRAKRQGNSATGSSYPGRC